eukprot:CAMPEP_0183453410 /NCGR_PEP_ID=MMETSP0370-20130417/120857_1 /TAXON_ID=268820 /ORGANISM="Peridinium aciculiferum, Strain PAER-2" /LENGTH=265 /DNA_ID=CAMNT_0025644799 /DNA_START=84 /DNA_END=877 /DNA_ORIENTATION=+
MWTAMLRRATHHTRAVSYKATVTLTCLTTDFEGIIIFFRKLKDMGLFTFPLIGPFGSSVGICDVGGAHGADVLNRPLGDPRPEGRQLRDGSRRELAGALRGAGEEGLGLCEEDISEAGADLDSKAFRGLPLIVGVHDLCPDKPPGSSTLLEVLFAISSTIHPANVFENPAIEGLDEEVLQQEHKQWRLTVIAVAELAGESLNVIPDAGEAICRGMLGALPGPSIEAELPAQVLGQHRLQPQNPPAVMRLPPARAQDHLAWLRRHL